MTRSAQRIQQASAGEKGQDRGVLLAVVGSMTINYQEIAAFWADEYERYSRAFTENPSAFTVDRVLPTARVCWSDLTTRFPELLDVDPADAITIWKLIRREARRRKLNGYLSASR